MQYCKNKKPRRLLWHTDHAGDHVPDHVVDPGQNNAGHTLYLAAVYGYNG